MHTTAYLQRQVEEGIRNLSFNTVPESLYEPVRYVLGLGGKRMRPVLTLMGCDLYGGDTAGALMPALGIELFHNFTLLHDDIMDRAPLRRGKTTVHTRWNTATAILAGDVLFVRSWQLMSMCDDRVVRAVTELFSRTAIEVCEGQQIDLDFEGQSDIAMDDYLRMITLKTSVLPAASLMTGALIGGAAPEDAARLYECGKNIGIAFQVKDDLLDVYGDQAKFGKQTGGDILANKKTCLLIKALELNTASDRAALLNLYSGGKSRNGDKVEAVTALFDKVNVKEHLRELMTRYYDLSVACLDQARAPEENKKALRAFLDSLMQREW